MKHLARKVWNLFFKKPPSEIFGRIIYPFLPSSVKKKCIDSFFNRTGFIGFLTNAVAPMLEKAYFTGSDEQIRKDNRQLFWGDNFGQSWHNTERNRYQSLEDYASTESFLRYRKPLIEQVKDLHFNSICEIGTGNGLFIKYLSTVFPSHQLYALDINNGIIEDNKRIYAGSNITFVADSENDFLYNKLPDNSLIISVGTFQCFTQEELKELLRSLKNSRKKVTIALSEPFDIDPEKDEHSEPRHAALISHPYEKIFTALQFQIRSKLYLKRRLEDTRNNYIILTVTNY
jgi:trans-aconitate methyltransferase